MIDLYRTEYRKHRAAGDDPMNAAARIVDDGCPLDVAEAICLSEDDDEEEDLEDDEEDDDYDYDADLDADERDGEDLLED